MIKSFLELTETDSVVKVSIKVAISVRHAGETLVELDPEQVQHSLKLASRVPVLDGVPILLVTREAVINLFRLVFDLGLRNR